MKLLNMVRNKSLKGWRDREGGWSLPLDSKARCEVTEGSEVTAKMEGHTWVQKHFHIRAIASWKE